MYLLIDRQYLTRKGVCVCNGWRSLSLHEAILDEAYDYRTDR
jgi:hypothetical protein